METTGYRLLPARGLASEPPVLDAAQQAVVDHQAGPLLVLAGPGSGKTTVLVEAAVRRIEKDRVEAAVRRIEKDRVEAAARRIEEDQAEAVTTPLLLTFSRRAAAELRSRISSRLGRSMATPMAMTFHGFCFALLRRFGAETGLRAVDEPEAYGGGACGSGIRLLTAPEQEFRLRETLEGSLASHLWPDSVREAYRTRAFAGELRHVLARARQLGMDGDDLVAVGERAGRADWAAAGRFMEEYLEVLDFEQVLDYAELVHRCRILLTEPHVRRALQDEIGQILVDEYQDTDPSQVALLKSLVARGAPGAAPRSLIVVGDPDQSIYGFRGADPRALGDFPTDFPTPEGDPAPVIALTGGRRFGVRITAATRRVADRLPLGRPLPGGALTRFRDLAPDPGTPRGRVEAYTFESAGAEAEHLADLLRQAHLHDGVAWDQMAVLVRSGRRTIPGLSRALTAAGVPIEVAGDEIALSAELAVRPLLLALQVLVDGRVFDPDQANRLLLSPLGGLDSLQVRRLGRDLREAERAELAGAGLPPLSDELIMRALRDPERFDDCAELLGRRGPELDRAQALARLLIEVEQQVVAGASAQEALWALWSGTEWPQRLRAEATSGTDLANRADRDLDAVCALFDVAARSEDVSGHRGLESFLAEVENQQIPADTQREADVRGGAVRVMTAHRAKGMEWDLVVLASVQEGVWPDLRRRGTLLEADRLTPHGLAEPQASGARLAEERRLFYVGATRARRRLVVSAIEGTEGEGDQPSRFVTELGVPVRHLPGRPSRPLTVTGLIGELRRTAVDPQASPALREAAAVRLARLADANDDRGRPIASAADPARWWGLDELTVNPQPRGQEPIRISGSELGSILDCPRQWFLGRRVNAEHGRTTAASTGEVVHVLIDHAATEGVELDDLVEHLDLVWDQIDFDANYLSAVERVEAEAGLERYVAWEQANRSRVRLGSEVRFGVTIDVEGHPVEIHGTVDRLDRLSDGRLRIVDFKTGRRAADKRDVPTHPQLGLYQLAAQQGAFDRLTGGERRLAGAELVYLRVQEKCEPPYPTVLTQASLDEQPHVDHPAVSEPEADQHDRRYPTWVHQRVAEAADIIRTERFEARTGRACQWCSFAESCPARAQGRQVIG